MTKQIIHVGVEESGVGYDRFVKAWHKSEKNEQKVEVHLNYEDFDKLISVLTPKRLELLRALRKSGPLSVRALAGQLSRNYKNVHTDCAALEDAGLIDRGAENLIAAPWDVIDAHVQLVA